MSDQRRDLKSVRAEIKEKRAARNEEVSAVTGEKDKMASRLNSAQRGLARQQKTLDDLIAHSDAEIARWTKEAPSTRRDHYIYLYTVRKLIAQKNIEFSGYLLNFNPGDKESMKAFMANQTRMELLKAESRFLSTEYSVVNYRPVIRAVEDFMGGGAQGRTNRLSGSAGPAAGSGPLAQRRAGTGPLSAAAGSGPLSQGQPQRPAGTGPLSAANAQRPGGTQPRLSQPGAAPARPGTGPLSARTAGASAGGPMPGGTGNMHPVLVKLQQADLPPESRRHMEVLLQQFKEIDQELAALRGAEIGSLAISPQQAVEVLNKLNGKIYYMNRTIAQLGPVADALAFEPEETDPEWDDFAARQSVGQEAAGTPDANAQGLTGKLKSFFNIR